jgi:hypothetical protein
MPVAKIEKKLFSYLKNYKINIFLFPYLKKDVYGITKNKQKA